MTVFSARKLNHKGASDVPAAASKTLLGDVSMSPEPPITHIKHEELLTKTEKYTVSRLNRFPQLLESTVLSRGTIASGFSAVVDDGNIHLWNYSDNISSSPITLSFPYENLNQYGLEPIVVLIPNEDTPSDPGLVILDPFNGNVKYYESIINAPLLKVLNFKIFELNLKLNNEFIALVEYIKDLGLLIATSTKKIILVTLTDEFNKPHLNKLELTNSSSSSFNFISSIFSHTNKAYDVKDFNLKNNRILAIREISSSSNATRQVVIQDSDANFEIWEFNKKSISSKLKLNLKESLCSFLTDIYDNIEFSFKILDLIPLREISNDAFLILASFDHQIDNNDSINGKKKNLVLFTVKITEGGVFIYSTYKITCFIADLQDVPKLILPKPFNTCFIVVNNSVILAEVVTSLDPTKLTQLNYKTKWEDIISLKSSVDIIGYGCDSENELLILTSNSGLLKIVKFQNHDIDELMVDELDLNLQLQQEPMLFIKSHIEQAVYFGTDQSSQNPMLFYLPKNEEFNAKDVEAALLKVLNELILNESKYLPKIYPSVEEFLKRRNRFVSTLTDFILNNFKELSSDLKILILNLLNKFQIALNFYSIIKLDSKLMELTKEIVSNLTQNLKQQDLIRDFFFNNLTEILNVVYEFLKQNKDNSRNLQLLSSIGVSYLKFEKTVRYDKLVLDNDYDFYTDNKPLLVENDQFLPYIVDFYNSTYANRDTLSLLQREQLTNLSEFLFYSFNDILCYSRSQNLEFTTILIEIYELNKFKWIDMLTDNNMDALVLNISETFKDMTSIVEVLLKNDQDDDAQKLQYYFDKFGYQFAYGYYTYLIDHKFFTRLYKIDTSSYLERFFVENQHFNKFYWIYQLQSGNYAGLITTLTGLEDESIYNKQTNLSLAKLSLIQEGDDIKEINYQLELCEFQLEIGSTDFIPQRLSEKLKLGKILNTYELIDLLSNTKSESNFYKSYKIIKKLNDYEEFKLLFTRLILIDDWDFLNDQNKTDEYLTSMFKSTITYKTIYLITKISKDPLDLQIDKLINKDLNDRLDSTQLAALDDELVSLDKKYQLNDWLQSIISMTQD